MSRNPDYEVKVGRRVEQGEKSYATKVGVGFTNRAGGINVLLDPGVAIFGGQDVQIVLWPWKPREERNYQGGGRRDDNRYAEEDARRQHDGTQDFGEDDIPF